MALITARATVPRISAGGRLAVLIHIAALLVTAELLLVFAQLADDGTLYLAGLLLDVFLILSLLAQSSYVATRDPRLSAFLGALVLAPLIRVLSLSTPFTPFTILEWLAIVSVPILLAVFLAIHTLDLRLREVYLSLGDTRYLTVNVSVGAFGLVLGFVEYQILAPDPWIGAPDALSLAVGTVVVLLATGISEELIFRGVLLRTALPLLGRWAAVLFVTVIFAALHIGFLSFVDLVFVFLVGLFFALVVLATESLLGVIVAHTLTNVMLYLVLPFGVL